MDRFSILSLDGGGIRGVFAAGVLAGLEEQLGQPVSSHFDLIAGTSTGGIIATALGLGLSPKEILAFYQRNGDRIFPTVLPKWIRRLPGANLLEPTRYRALWRRKFSNEPLASALKDALGAGTRLGASRKRLVITSFDLQRRGPKVFKTAHHERFANDYKRFAWEVALATSAAPTYLPAAKADDRFLVDGGLWANDPIMVGITEAMGVLGASRSQIRVLSIGTLDEIGSLHRSSLSGGQLRWAKRAPELMLAGQSMAVQGQARLLIGSEHVVRVNPPAPAGRYLMDDTSCIDELVGIAAGEAEHRAPEIRRLFADRLAPEFIPFHGEHHNGRNDLRAAA